MACLAAAAMAAFVLLRAAPAGAEPSANSPPKHWVFFVDKGAMDAATRAAAVSRASGALGERTLARRALRGTIARRGGEVVGERDLPVAAAYRAEIAKIGAEIVVESRWLNGVSVRASEEQLARIAALPFVRGVQPVARMRREPAPDRPPTGEAPTQQAARDAFYGRSFDQLAQIRLTELHAQGYTGAGVVIGVLDTGFARWHEAFNDPGHGLQVLAEWDFVRNDANAGFDPTDPVVPIGQYQHAHGTYILGLLAAYRPGELVGAAYDAAYVLAKTEDIAGEYPAEEDLYVAGLEFVELHGADLATSSLAYSQWYEYTDMDGRTAVTTIAVNIATSNGLICCTAAGNGGRDQDLPSLAAPGDAFDVITVGAVNAAGVLTDFSSGGPTADGRIKPEVLALGESASSVHHLDTNGYNDDLDGTSISTPLVAGAVACLLQAHPNWGVAEIRQNLLQTAQDYVVTGVPDPQSHRGYGLVDAFAAAQDCNGNDVADGTEIRAGTLGDCNANGRADACDFGDFSGDGAIDLADLAGLVGCLSGPCASPACTLPGYSDPCCAIGDIDGDGDVDLADYAAWSGRIGF
jgi:subtilisin family serine protease